MEVVIFAKATVGRAVAIVFYLEQKAALNSWEAVVL